MRSERLKDVTQKTIGDYFTASKGTSSKPSLALKSKNKHKQIKERAKTSVERLETVFISSIGEAISIGDDVYMALTDDISLIPGCEEEEDECCICHRGITRNSGPMVECERCLGGYHIRCLKPCLKSIPQGDWFCPECVRGAELPTRPPSTACEQFLWGKDVVQVARIIDIVKNRQRDGEIEVRVRFFLPPESTRMGRLEHHKAREVFCSTSSYYESIDCVVRRARVCTLSEFNETAGNDVFLCEFSYNEQWHRFIRWGGKRQSGKKVEEEIEEGSSEESDPLGGSSEEEEEYEGSEDEASSSEGDDEDSQSSAEEGSDEEDVSLRIGNKRKGGTQGRATKKGKGGGGGVQRPVYAFWAERGLLKGNLSDRIQKNLEKDKKAREKLLQNKSGGKGLAANKLLGGGWGEGAMSAAIGGGSSGGGLDVNEQGEEAVDATTRYGFEALADSILSKQGASSVAPVGRSISLDHPERGSGLLGEARRALSLSAAPRELPCREAEKARISKFVEDLVIKGAESSGVMYICGIPGTGKTACISEVLSRGPLRTKASQAGVQIISINALTLPTPLHIYSKLWERLAGQRCGPGKALSMLEALFAPQQPPGALAGTQKGTKEVKRNFMTLLVVDEIDILMTRDQSVLYNLFEWPTLTGARLSVIGISNTHDLDSRVLPRIASRLASSKLAFQPYNNNQLKTIALARLRDCNALGQFEDMAVEFVARRVASTSGDVRRVLELLRRAVDVAEEERIVALNQDKAEGREPRSMERLMIKKPHVTKAMEEVYSSTHMQFVRQCSLVEKAIMVALMLEMRATKRLHASIHSLHTRIETHLVLLIPDCRCNEGAVLSLCHGLVTKGLLISSPAWHHLRMRVQFRVDSADVAAGIKDDQRLSSIHTLMSSSG